MEAADPFDLGRFLTAQAPVFASAVDELNAGRKRSHCAVTLPRPRFAIGSQRRLGISGASTARRDGVED
jgi:uncharacterized protein (DUF1810 family)